MVGQRQVHDDASAESGYLDCGHRTIAQAFCLGHPSPGQMHADSVPTSTDCSSAADHSAAKLLSVALLQAMCNTLN